MISYKEAVSRNIKTYRKAAGITQKELAAAVGVVETSIINWEKGTSSPDLDKIMLICKKLDISPAQLFDAHDDVEDSEKEDRLDVLYKRADDKTKQLVDILLGRK